MGWITKALGLTLKVPTAGTKNWADGLLTDFVEKISAHNHTGSPNGLAIGATAIVNGAVSALKLATDAVETAKIKDANVTAAKLATDAVETLKIKDDAVTTDKILDDAITTDKILDGAVTAAKLAAGVAHYLTPYLSGFGINEYNSTEEILPQSLVSPDVTPVLDMHDWYYTARVALEDFTLTRLQVRGYGTSASQNCNSVVKVYKNNVYTGVSLTFNRTTTSYGTAGADISIAVSQGDHIMMTVTGSGVSGQNVIMASIG